MAKVQTRSDTLNIYGERSVQRIFGYSNIFKYFSMSILICPNIRRFFQSKNIRSLIQEFFLLLNIFRHSFRLLDSDEYIQIYSLHKIKLFMQQMLSILIYVISIKLVHTLYSDLFIHSFVSILHGQIYSNIHS